MQERVNDHILEVCLHDFYVFNACGNFTKFTTQVQLWTRMKWLNVEVKRSKAPCGAGHPLPPCPFTSLYFPTFYFSLSFIGFNYFLLLSIPSLSTRIVPLCFQARGCRRRPNLGLVCVLLCNLCNLYSLVKMDCGVLFYLV